MQQPPRLSIQSCRRCRERGNGEEREREIERAMSSVCCSALHYQFIPSRTLHITFDRISGKDQWPT